MPLLEKTKELLIEHGKVRTLKTNLLFPSIKPDKPIFIRRSFQDAVIAAEVEDFRFHYLRHSAASYMLMTGASLGEIAELLRH